MSESLSESPVLTLTGVKAWYGHAQALFGLDLTVGKRETVALLGRNGAGKTTALRSVMGIQVRRTGDVDLEGSRLKSNAPDAVARRGVGWVPEDRRIFPNLTVRENLRLAQKAAAQKDRRPLSVDEIIGLMPIMARLIDRKGSALSGGEQQAVSIARALAPHPKLLLLDEPTEGLAPVIVHELAASVARMPAELDLSILVAEQNLAFVSQVATRVYVLDTGRLAWTGAAADFAASTDLKNEYLSVGSGE